MDDLSSWYPDARRTFRLLDIPDARRRDALLRTAAERAGAGGFESAKSWDTARAALDTVDRRSLMADYRGDPRLHELPNDGDLKSAKTALLAAEDAITARDLVGRGEYSARDHLELLWPVVGIVRPINESGFALAYERQIRLIADRPHGDSGLRLDVLVDRTGLHDVEESEFTESPMDLRLEHEPGGRLVIRFALDLDDAVDAGSVETIVEIAHRHHGERRGSTWFIPLDRDPLQAAVEAVRLIAEITGLGEHDLIELIPYDDDDWHLRQSERAHEDDWYGIRSFPVQTLEAAARERDVVDRAQAPLTPILRAGGRTRLGMVRSPKAYSTVPPLLIAPHPGRPARYRFALRGGATSEHKSITVAETFAESEEEAYALCVEAGYQPIALWSVGLVHVSAHSLRSGDHELAMRGESKRDVADRAKAWGLETIEHQGDAWVGAGDQLDAALHEALAHPELDWRWAQMLRSLGWSLEFLAPGEPVTLRFAGLDAASDVRAVFNRRADGTTLVEVSGPGEPTPPYVAPRGAAGMLPPWAPPRSPLGRAHLATLPAAASAHVAKIVPAFICGFTIAADALALLTATWSVAADRLIAVEGGEPDLRALGLQRNGYDAESIDG